MEQSQNFAKNWMIEKVMAVFLFFFNFNPVFANILLCHQIPASTSYSWEDQSCQSDDQWTITGTQITLQITCPL